MSAAVPRTRPVVTAPAAAPARPLRLLPAPPSDPPYDDELRGRPALHLVGAPGTDGGSRRATRRLTPGHATSARPVAPAAARLTSVRAAPATPAALPDDSEPTRTPASALPASRPFAHALVQRLLEVCAGARPVSQLRRDTTPGLYDEIERALSGRPQPTSVRPTRRDIRSVHVQERPDGVAEVCATVQRAGRAGALALRLEGRCGRWLCTELLGL